MSALKFTAEYLNGKKFVIDSIISFELSKNIGAACDGLRLFFKGNKPIGCINRIFVYNNDTLIFNGYCDIRREKTDENGIEAFIYARSSACLLTDNEAKPFTYNCPSAISLFLYNAESLGFKNGLPELYCESDYQVKKGTSCFGAINDFVCGLTSKEIIVTPDNVLILPHGNKNVFLNDYNVLSEKKVVNRADAVSRIDYKIDSNNDYIYHIKSRFLENEKIIRTRKLNLSSLPKWQREYTLMNKLKSYSSSYETFEIVIDGIHSFSLYDEVFYKSSVFSDIDGCYISGVCCSCDKNGEKTKIVLNKKIDLQEITYVAE